MKRHPHDANVVWFEPDEVLKMIRERLIAEGVTAEICGLQIAVEQPFGDGTKVHNEVPRLNVILSDVKR